MSDWKKRFSQKLDVVKDASRDQFDQVGDQALAQLFDEFRDFTAAQGFAVAKPVSKPGMRIYRFGVAENCYTLLTFRLAGLEQAELHAEWIVPGWDKSQPLVERVDLANFDMGWARRMFERVLDQFLDAYMQSLGDRNENFADLIEA